MSNLAFGFKMPVIPNEFWPNIEIGETANFTYDATNDITANGVVDPILSASISIQPSGTGELIAQSLTVTVANARTYITAILSGATVAGRTYTHNIRFTTQGGITLPILIGQVCDPVLAQTPIPPPPNPGFGTPVTWP